jgi:hypothetical protein
MDCVVAFRVGVSRDAGLNQLLKPGDNRQTQVS